MRFEYWIWEFVEKLEVDCYKIYVIILGLDIGCEIKVRIERLYKNKYFVVFYLLYQILEEDVRSFSKEWGGLSSIGVLQIGLGRLGFSREVLSFIKLQ